MHRSIWVKYDTAPLKPYGFPVHACIDGFSRRILWLKVCRTNNNPSVTAGFYLEYVHSVEGCPIVLRTDCRTENGTMAAKGSKIGGPFYVAGGHRGGSTFLRIRWRSAISTHQMSYRWNVCGSVFRIYFNMISTESRSTGIHNM